MKSRGRKSFQRRGPVRDPAMTFHIFSEGKNTEPDYFHAIQTVVDPQKVRIKCHGPNGVPKSVVKDAKKFAVEHRLGRGKRRPRDSFEERDQVWAVFDRDEFRCYNEAKGMARDSSIPFAYSDPCFELWLNLHFGDSEAPCNSAEAQKKTKKLIRDYDPKSGKTADFTELMPLVEQAEERAERQRKNRHDQGDEDGNPSTSVYELVREIKRNNS